MLQNDSTSQEEHQRIDQFTLHLLSDIDDSEPQLLTLNAVKATCHRHTVQKQVCFSHFGAVESLAMSSAAISVTFKGEDKSFLPVPKYSHTDLVQMQRDDPAIGKVICLIEAGDHSSANFKATDLHLVTGYRCKR